MSIILIIIFNVCKKITSDYVRQKSCIMNYCHPVIVIGVDIQLKYCMSLIVLLKFNAVYILYVVLEHYHVISHES